MDLPRYDPADAHLAPWGKPSTGTAPRQPQLQWPSGSMMTPQVGLSQRGIRTFPRFAGGGATELWATDGRVGNSAATDAWKASSHETCAGAPARPATSALAWLATRLSAKAKLAAKATTQRPTSSLDM